MTNPPTSAVTSVPDEAAVKALQAELRGTLLRPGDDGYDAARAVFNRMIDRRPALIARCRGVADVIAAVRFARSRNLPVSVRSGGHSVSGNAVCNGGLMIDLSQMKGIHVDPVRRTVRAEAGLLLREFDHETQAFGLATPMGVVSTTGIAGLTLGGGIGWLSGKYGLACDNLLSVDLVTADAQLLVASEDENPDLFWGVRGGGGNFGIVTSFEYRLHPVRDVLFASVDYSAIQAHTVLRQYDRFARACPDEVSTVAGIRKAEDGTVVISLSACYCGDLEAGESLLSLLLSFGSPRGSVMETIHYVDLQRLPDVSFPHGRFHYWKASFLREISADTIAAVVESVEAAPSPFTSIALQQMHGAASRVSPTASAFAHRYDQYDFLIFAQWLDPADTAENISWVRSCWKRLRPHLEQAVYVNNLGEEDQYRVRAAYGPNYERLAALKQQYDPTNFFHLNLNIKPSP